MGAAMQGASCSLRGLIIHRFHTPYVTLTHALPSAAHALAQLQPLMPPWVPLPPAQKLQERGTALGGGSKPSFGPPAPSGGAQG